MFGKIKQIKGAASAGSGGRSTLGWPEVSGGIQEWRCAGAWATALH